MHHKSETQITFDNLKVFFNTSFYTQIIQGCVICRLNRNVYKHNTSGEHREFQNDLTVGAICCSDVAHLPKSKNGFKYVLLFCERITSYISLTLLNMRTQAVLTVVHSRVTHLELDTLLDFDIGMPDLYEKLAKAISH